MAAKPTTPAGVVLARVRSNAEALMPLIADEAYRGGRNTESMREYWAERWREAELWCSVRREEEVEVGLDMRLAVQLYAALKEDDQEVREELLGGLADMVVAYLVSKEKDRAE